MLSLFISCPKGVEELLKKELSSLSIEVSRMTVGGVYVDTSLEAYYRIVLWSRLANRVLILLYNTQFKHIDDLYKASATFDWYQCFDLDETISIDFRGTNTLISNSMYGAQVIKDGLSDAFRAIHGRRPSVDKRDAGIQIKAYLRKTHIEVYLDAVGFSLHRRGYRQQQGGAPLKENIAAAMLSHANWHDLSKEKYALLDPFCGSGTILIEAMLMATKKAPGLLRDDHHFASWRQHDPALWEKEREKANACFQPYEGALIGFDNDARIIKSAKENIRAAGFDGKITVSCKDIKHFSCPSHLKEGLLISNPPYGERMSEVNELLPVYQTLGRLAKQYCTDWHLAVMTSEEKLSRAIGLKSSKRYKLKNGALDCQLALFHLHKENQFNTKAAAHISPEGEMLLNRLNKNLKKLKPWLKKEGIQCYRLYDADLPEFNAAIDLYDNWAHVQEYAPPKSIDETKAKKRITTVCDVLQHGLGFESDKIILKQRQRQRSDMQYNSFDEQDDRFLVQDGAVKCWVNLKDYLDTGLFLDHRRLRKQFASLTGKTFLNLFSYTGVASLHAAYAGAITTNVDLSKTYLNWAKDNFRANHLTIDKHHFIHADVFAWLKGETQLYDTIFCDPPSFSNSKRMEGVLDIQRDHKTIIELSMARLKDSGRLYFSCNLKRFKLDESLKDKYTIKTISKETTSRDFETAKIKHQSFQIELNVKK